MTRFFVRHVTTTDAEN